MLMRAFGSIFVLFICNQFLVAQPDNIPNVLYTSADSMIGYTQYKLMDVGKDSSLNYFERKTIALTRVPYTQDDYFSFQFDGLFTFAYGGRKILEEMRAYYHDANGNLVHTNDTMSRIVHNYYQGKYKIDNDGTVLLTLEKESHIGKFQFLPIKTGIKIFRYQIEKKSNNIILHLIQ